MYSKLPAFVFGFHGCDAATKEAVLSKKEELRPSTNAYDWLGSGIYFWEQNYSRAMAFAKLAHTHPGRYTSKPVNEPAVIGAVIDLGNCLNLMDSLHIERLKAAYDLLKATTQILGTEMPQNKGHSEDKPLRMLDRAVIETLHRHIENSASPFDAYDTARGLYVEGGPVYPDAGFRAETHIQLCVRNINCIKAYFDPRRKQNEPFKHLGK